MYISIAWLYIFLISSYKILNLSSFNSIFFLTSIIKLIKLCWCCFLYSSICLSFSFIVYFSSQPSNLNKQSLPIFLHSFFKCNSLFFLKIFSLHKSHSINSIKHSCLCLISSLKDISIEQFLHKIFLNSQLFSCSKIFSLNPENPHLYLQLIFSFGHSKKCKNISFTFIERLQPSFLQSTFLL